MQSVGMSTPHKMHADNVRHRMAELGIRDAKHLAELVNIPYGTLRNAVSGRDPMRLDRIYAVAHVLARRGEPVRTVVADILATNDGVPDEPPKQPARPKSPPKRQDSESTKKAPRRNAAGVA